MLNLKDTVADFETLGNTFNNQGSFQVSYKYLNSFESAIKDLQVKIAKLN